MSSLRPCLLLLLLAGALPADPVELTVSPAPPARNLYKWQLLPDLLTQKPGDAVPLYAKAHAALEAVEPDRDERQKLSVEMEELRTMPLAEVDKKRLAEIVGRYKAALEMVEQAARSERAEWDGVTERLRKGGIGALLPEVQQARDFLSPLHLRCRLYLLEDRPEKAVQVATVGFGLARQVNDCPTLIGHLVAVAIAQVSLDMLQDCLGHPKCPGLYGPLTDLPRPFLPVRKSYEGERIMCYGTIPGLAQVAANPMHEIDAKTLDQILRMYRGLLLDMPGNRPELRLLDRITLANEMKAKHAKAKEALRAAGFDDATIDKVPVLNAGLLHAALEYEEGLGRMAAAAMLPFPLARAQFDELARKYPDREPGKRGPDEAAFPLRRIFLPHGDKILLSDLRLQRRIESLRTAEALRQHAATTGKWPASLDEVKGTPLPLDPATLKPFEYSRDGDTAVIHVKPDRKGDPAQQDVTVRLTLRKPEGTKP